jgi:hypothetical protein
VRTVLFGGGLPFWQIVGRAVLISDRNQSSRCFLITDH